MKILITENQFKRLVENIINEKYNIYDDPKASVLAEYLNDRYPDKEIGIMDIELYGYANIGHDGLQAPIYRVVEEKRIHKIDIVFFTVLDDMEYFENKDEVDENFILDDKIKNYYTFFKRY